jgi:hypothetical protein
MAEIASFHTGGGVSAVFALRNGALMLMISSRSASAEFPGL